MGTNWLLGTFYKLTSGAPENPIEEIAPITRRPVNIDTAYKLSRNWHSDLSEKERFINPI